ncbi:MAG: hypothetical protein A2X54_09445 [Nitrospirae bacterium GWF2_44_13]|nr:MAG: hypothetical protein A2X54_09445 [Nitrospirae bacterium GWF2_44_13]
MGIARGMIKLLMREAKRKCFKGSILTIGRQDIFASEKDLRKWAEEMDFQLKTGIEMTISDKDGFRNKKYITDKALFQSLGFNNVESIDYSDYERCTIVHDLNKDVPCHLYDKYDFVFDGGSSEHIFNLTKVFENYNRMLKVGGRIIHESPSSNYTDHGFYMFSPTLFYDYYYVNKWDIIDSFFIKHSSQPNKHLWNIYRYEPGLLNVFAFGGLDKGTYLIYFNAEKTDDSTFDASVQQRSCVKRWKTDTGSGLSTYRNIEAISKDFPGGIRQLLLSAYPKIKAIFYKIPYDLRERVRLLYYKFLIKIPLRFHLKLIARY